MKKSLKLAVALFTLLFTAVSVFAKDDWLSSKVPSFKETYSQYFDYVGISAEYGNWGNGWGVKGELTYKEVQNGLKKHADTITLGNCFKPQFIFGWWGNNPTVTKNTYTASNGITIQIPQINNLERLGAIMQICKDNGLKMRGHVLVWHGQTDEAFFREDYNKNKKLVSKDEMTARQEWYIKTVLEYVTAWEKKNNGGKHIIWAWDVVNEAAADDATKANFARGSTPSTKDKSPTDYPQGSRWFQIYGNDEFIVNAFRFANAYAPSDVKLCYNDYNEYMDYNQGWKTTAILKIIENIRAGKAQMINGKSVKPRIDAMGMQSHLGVSWPGVNGFESALKRYLAAGLDVHITEMDFSAQSQEEAAKAYGEYFKMLKKYGKNNTSYKGKHITCVTVWGINNENSWISNSNGKKQYPLLFTKEGGKYYPNDSFWAIMGKNN